MSASERPRRVLPAHPNLRFLKDEAKRRVKSGEFETLSSAQLAIAREHGMASWPRLKESIASVAQPKGKEAAWHSGTSFEVTLPRSVAFQALKSAGLEADAFRDLGNELLRNARKPVEVPEGPAEAQCWYTASDPPVGVRVTVLRYGLPTDLRIDVDDNVVCEKIRSHLFRVSAEHKDRITDELAHTNVWAQVEEILGRDGLTYQQIQREGAVLTRRAVESIMNLSGQAPGTTRMGLLGLLTNVSKQDREFVARWLIEQFEKPDADDQLGVRIYEVAVPAIGEDLIRLISDRRYGARRGDLCMSLIKTKHKRAAEVTASLLGEEGCTRWAIECLGRLRAVRFVDDVKQLLRDPDPDIRREAKRTLKKLGAAVSAPPPPAHLVKSRRALPKGLEEWSANLDLGELEGTLESLARGVDSGFGAEEVAEVTGVADEMRLDQTKVFRFPITQAKKASDLWLVIFMDDTDSPDLEVHADAAVIQKLESIVDKPD